MASAVAAALGGGGGVESGGGGGGGGGVAGEIIASLNQPGASFQPPKRQLISYLDDTWRVSRDESSYSVYSRVPMP